MPEREPVKLKKKPMKLVVKPKTAGNKPVVAKLGKEQKQKQKDANLANAEKVMAQFESGAVDTKTKKAKVNGAYPAKSGAPKPRKAQNGPATPKPEGSNQLIF